MAISNVYCCVRPRPGKLMAWLKVSNYLYVLSKYLLVSTWICG